jgi:non-homologous end joining protein Ku
MIQQKIEGQDITTAEPVSTGGDKIIDLMEALKASLSKTAKAAEIPVLLPDTSGQGKQMVS